MDEKEYIMSMISNAMILISAWAKYKLIPQSEIRKSITVIKCINSTKNGIPPFIIWLVKMHRNAWYPINTDLSVHFVVSFNSYTNGKLEAEWLEKCFKFSIQENLAGKNRLLIIDGHESHLTVCFLRFCPNNDILLLHFFCPHYTCFGSLWTLDALTRWRITTKRI